MKMMTKLVFVCATLVSLVGCGSNPSSIFNIIWKNWDGTELLKESYNYGETPSYKLELPKKEGDEQYYYTFDKWSPEITPVKSDVVYIATFKQNTCKYNITWKMDDGSVLRTDEVAYGDMPIYGKNPTKESPDEDHIYVFNKWSPTITSVVGNAEYIASFNLVNKNYDITWKMDNGSILRVDSVEYGNIPRYGANPTKDPIGDYSFSFNSWVPQISSVTGPATYTAKFDKYRTIPAVTFSFRVANDSATMSFNCSGDIDIVEWDDEFSHDTTRRFFNDYGSVHNCKIHGNINSFSTGIHYSDYCRIQNIELTHQITTIPDEAFYGGCGELASIIIPNSVEAIGKKAFYYCESLKTIIFEEESKLKTIGDSAFLGCLTAKSLVTIPNGVISIGDAAFNACKGNKVIIPKSVLTVGDNAFRGSFDQICCEVDSKPSGWSDDWTDCENVVWGYKSVL